MKVVIADRGRGQSLVELALIAPIVILLAMAVWDGGSVLREQVVLQQAARDGARVAASAYGSADPTVVGHAVTASAKDLPALSSPGYLTISYPDGQSVQVQVTYAHALMTPVLRQLWAGGAGTITLQASATFFLPRLTPVPATLVPPTATSTLTSTPTPTPSPTRTSTSTSSPTSRPSGTPTPTLTPSASPTPTSSPTPTISRICTPNPSVQLLPSLGPGYGFWCTLALPTSNYVLIQWQDNGDSGNVIGLYATPPDPFAGSADPALSAPPANNLTFNSRSNATTLWGLSGCLASGTYELYFYNRGAALAQTTTATSTAQEWLFAC